VDTGMGLERVTSVLQGKLSNYDTDIFMPIFDAIQKATGARPYTFKLGAEDVDGVDMAYRVIADHIRTLTFAITDGAVPSNDGRGYVLRRVLRRGVRYGQQFLKAQVGFFAGLVDIVVETLGDAFPELRTKIDHVKAILREEEESFSRTLSKGIERFDKIASTLPQGGVVSAKDAFFLYSSMGFPVDLTQLMALERGLTVDVAGFNEQMALERERSRGVGKSSTSSTLKLDVDATNHLDKVLKLAPTDDSFKYVWQPLKGATVLAILTGKKGDEMFTQTAKAGDIVGIVLDRTSFYAESGGQIYDTGALTGGGVRFEVDNTQAAAGYVLHTGTVDRGTINVGQQLNCEVDYERRALVAPNHTCTHVLNFALRKVLGTGVDQKGSAVLPDKLRFDYSTNRPSTADELIRVEQICREQIAANHQVYVSTCVLGEAKKITALRAVFGEVYPENVRVVSIGVPVEELLANPTDERWNDYSIEFCGGTHLSRLSEAKTLVLVEESALAKGIRRATALTGPAAIRAMEEAGQLSIDVEQLAALPDEKLEAELPAVNKRVKEAQISIAAATKLNAQLDNIVKRIKAYNKQMDVLRLEGATRVAIDAASKAKTEGKAYCVCQVEIGVDTGIAYKVFPAVQKVVGGDVALFMISTKESRVLCVGQCDASMTAKLPCDKWVIEVVKCVGGAKGGGKKNQAAAQGTDPSGIPAALQAAADWAEKALH